MVTHFNPTPPTIMHLDLNSCFASVEQQANPLLRGKPLAVVHSDASYGCILAPSVEAKLWGIKTGMTLEAGKLLCPWLIARVADPPKYRQIHSQFAKLLSDYSPHVISKSIDEFVVVIPSGSDPVGVAFEVKSRIKSEIGNHLRVSIGVSTNQNLAKLASGLHKPNGFDIIDSANFLSIYQHIKLQDFCGINIRNEARLHRVGIYTALQFYGSNVQTLCSAFGSVLGRYWYSRLRGYEVDDVEFSRRSFGQSYVLPHPMIYEDWRPILAKLVAKAARRLRASCYHASATHLYLRFANGASWHTGHQLHNPIFRDCDLLASALSLNPPLSHPVKKIAVTFFGLTCDPDQLALLRDNSRDISLTHTLDTLNDKWGEYTITSAAMLGSSGHVRDAIAFGK
ncbi:MAG: hypothetical protein V1487_04060 [bacterium]